MHKLGTQLTIDIHSHYAPPETVRLISEGSFAPEIKVKSKENGMTFSFPSFVTRPLFDKMTDTERRIEHLNNISIDKQVLSTWIDLYGYDLPKHIARGYTTRINENLAETVRNNSDKFRFVSTVPLPWGDDAAAVLQDSVDRLGALGSMIGTNIAGANLDDPRLDPFWKASEELSVPVILHPVAVAGRNRMKSYYMANLIGYPMETAIAASSLIFGGVLDRFPKLNIVLLHGGGYFPHGIGRLDHGFHVRPETKSVKSAPSSYLERFFYDTIVYDHRIFDSLVKLVGLGSIVLGTDYPFDMEPMNLIEMVRTVLGQNATALLDENTRKLFPRL